MIEIHKDQLSNLGASNTYTEIFNQGKLWDIAKKNYFDLKEDLDSFLKSIISKHEKVRVIFTGAGTSAYVGDIVAKYLNRYQHDKFIFTSIPTTDIVSNPKENLLDIPTILVSFARSGNSPESLQALKLADKLVNNLYHFAITCAEEGKLYLNLKDRENAFNILMPEGSNDKAFAMTSSFTCMLLTSLLVFDMSCDNDTKKARVDKIINDFDTVISKFDKIKEIVDENDFNRIVYLGSGVFTPLTREAQLKILELTSGKITTCYDSSMGFRHGPKSFVDEKTMVVCFVSDDPYTRKYDEDIINEIVSDKIAEKVIAITNTSLNGKSDEFSLNGKEVVDDIVLVFGYIVFAQSLAMLTSIKIGNKPDTPSITGTVNRVVKGVTIHEL